MTSPPRRPVSTRHAFARAFALAFRRDPVASLIVPLLVRAPWIAALALLPPLEGAPATGRLVLWGLAALGDTIAALCVDAMLRVRARADFRAAADAPLPPVLDSFAAGLPRVPALFVTEVVRRLAIALGMLFFFVPGVLIAHRLAFATESVVLDTPGPGAAFRRSTRLTAGRFERWFELVLLSVAIVLASWFALALVMVAVRRFSIDTWGSLAYFAAAAVWPVLQYAWTFFYLRLGEVEMPEGIEVGPLYATAAPALAADPVAPELPAVPATYPPPDPGTLQPVDPA
jgi:hypothetical protein